MIEELDNTYLGFFYETLLTFGSETGFIWPIKKLIHNHQAMHNVTDKNKLKFLFISGEVILDYLYYKVDFLQNYC